MVSDAIAVRAFPGASVALTYRGKLVALKAFGRFTYEPDSPMVTPDTMFDLASISKVIATTSMAMVLYEGGLLDLDMPVVAAVPEFGGGDPRRREITIRMLLAHSSGLPAYEKLFLRAHTPEELLAAAFAVPLAADPGTVAVYSDVGFIVLGVALARLADERLDEFCYRHLPVLGMPDTLFNPPRSEEHTSELQSRQYLVCRLLLEKKKKR